MLSIHVADFTKKMIVTCSALFKKSSNRGCFEKVVTGRRGIDDLDESLEYAVECVVSACVRV